MPFSIHTHDAWGTVKVGDFQSLEEARRVFVDLCRDPWYAKDGGVKGVELVEQRAGGALLRRDWYGFRPLSGAGATPIAMDGQPPPPR